MLKFTALAAMSFLGAIPVCSAAAITADCAIEMSSYSLRSDPSVKAHFVKVPKVAGMASDLAFEITWQKGDAYWYTFDQGNSPYLNMVSITDPTAPDYKPPVAETVKRPHGDMQYLAMNDDKVFDDHLPVSGMRAPALILMPRLPELHPSGSEHSFFQLSGCAG